jgi:membrane protein CcdC involved in cytochrome C biogenesis
MPAARPLTPELRALFAGFAALALTAGALLFVGSEDTDRWFSWDIKPPLTAAFLGAAYWAAFVLLAWTARRRWWVDARATVIPVLLIAVLLLVATLAHLDKFDLDSLAGWFWLIAYIVVPPVMAVLLWRQLALSADEALEDWPGPAAPAWLRALLAFEAIVMLGVGIALYVAPVGAAELWPWPVTPLTARAVGAFVIGFGAAAAWAALHPALRGLAGSAYAYATLGALTLVALARYPDTLDATGLGEAAFVAFAALVLLTGLAGTVLRRRARGG